MRSINHSGSKALCIAFISFLALACAAFGQSPATFRLASIRVTGLSRFDAAQVISASGLHSNQNISVRDIQAAVEKLARTGFFERVAYRYNHNAGNMDLEFQVVETKELLPCFFDNFIGLSDSEILDAVRARMPLFRGSIPEVGTALQEATRVVQDLLRASLDFHGQLFA